MKPITKKIFLLGVAGAVVFGTGFLFGSDSYHFGQVSHQLTELQKKYDEDLKQWQKDLRLEAERHDGTKTVAEGAIKLNVKLMNDGKKLMEFLREIKENQRSPESCRWWELLLGRYDSSKKEYVFHYGDESPIKFNWESWGCIREG